jgi:hypothetical protein
MTEQTAFIEDTPSRAHDLVQAIVGTAVSLAIAAALGIWVLAGVGATGSPATAGGDRQRQAVVAEQVSGGSTPPIPAAAPVGDDALQGDTPPAFDVLSAQTVYLVASQQQADALRAGIEELNTIRLALDLPALEHEIVVFGSDDEETVFWLARAEQDIVRGNLGMPALHLVDLRDEGHGTAPRPTASLAAPATE